MNDPTILARVRSIVEKHSGQRDLPDDAPFGEPAHAGGHDLDSLDRIAIGMAVEEEFGFEMPDADVDLPEVGTIAGLAAYVERTLKGDG